MKVILKKKKIRPAERRTFGKNISCKINVKIMHTHSHIYSYKTRKDIWKGRQREDESEIAQMRIWNQLISITATKSAKKL